MSECNRLRVRNVVEMPIVWTLDQHRPETVMTQYKCDDCGHKWWVQTSQTNCPSCGSQQIWARIVTRGVPDDTDRKPQHS